MAQWRSKVDITYTISGIQNKIAEWKEIGYDIGFVPTMGYLHEGHASLIQKAKEQNDKVVVSIFVNPTQFAPNEDLDTYPRDFEADSALCKNLGVDLIFHPTPQEMYPHMQAGDAGTLTTINVPTLGATLCGKSRPTHFGGVCLVVTKLFNIVQPHNAYFGQKDYQQLAIIKAMVRDLNQNVNIIGCPIVREDTGLAKSSRNAYLNPQERAQANVLNQSLTMAKNLIDNGATSANEVIQAIKNQIQTQPLAKIDYIQIVDATTLTDVTTIDSPAVIALAVFFGKTRLIDNVVVKE